jgi:glycosyltransferase involved in cell wall biosynthesis
MKKTIFNVMLTKRTGGIEQAFIDYNDALSKNYKVISIVNNKCKVLEKIKTTYYKIRLFNKYDFLAAFKIRKLVKKHKPSLIIAHSTLAYVLCKLALTNVPIVAISHNLKFKHIRRSRYIVAITSDMKDRLKNICTAKVFEVPNMISLHGAANSSKAIIHKPLRMGFIGTLTLFKGCDLLIKAVGELVSEGVDIKLTIAGDGEERSVLEKLVKNLNLQKRTDFLGWLDFNAKLKFYQHIDMLCVPSREEAFGIVYLEAMKYSVPIISSKTSGGISVVKDVAILFERDDVASLKKAILKIYKNPAMGDEMVVKGNAAVQKYSLENIAEKLHTVVEEVLKQ